MVCSEHGGPASPVGDDMAPDLHFNRQKFRELILFIARESEPDRHFGATKLNKILYFSDFKAFAMLGRPITGATYVRLERGPAPQEMLPVLREMEKEGAIDRVERRYFNLLQKRVIAGQEPDMALFSALEIELVRNVILELHDMSASQVSALSHLDASWRLTDANEPISYGLAFVDNKRPSDAQIADYLRTRPDPSLFGLAAN